MISTRHIPVARPTGQLEAVQNRSRRFCLSLGSQFCAQASFRPFLTETPLPSASSYHPLRYTHYHGSVLLQGTCTPLVHAHAGRTPALSAGAGNVGRLTQPWVAARLKQIVSR